jgi:hypothetical protein
MAGSQRNVVKAILSAGALLAGLSAAAFAAHLKSPLDGCVSGKTFAFPATAAGEAGTVRFKEDGEVLRSGDGAKWKWTFSEYTPDGRFGNLRLASPAADPVRIPVTIGNDGRCVAHFLNSDDLDLGTVRK